MRQIYFLLIGFLLVTSHSIAQDAEEEPNYIIVDWKVGTKKTISQTDSTIIYSNDSLYMSTGVNSNYTMQVVDLNEGIYEVLFQQVTIDENIFVASELMDATPIEQMMQNLIVELQKKMAGFEYSFLVDQNTAIALEVKNQETLAKLVEEVIVIVLDQMLDAAKVELDTNQQNEMHLSIKQYMEEQMPAAMQTMLNAFNYIFQAYSFPFILDETYTSEVEVYSVDQIQNTGVETKAGLVVNSELNNSELTIDYTYVYDKESAYQDYIVSQGKGDQISIDDFEVDERVVSYIDLDSSWIINSTSFVNAKMGSIVVHNTTYVTIK